MAGIKDIAERAGVSIGTVDRVLHNRGRCSEATREKVLAIAHELNYSPNLNARRLKQKEPCRILVLMANLEQDQGYWKVCLKGIEQAQKEVQAIGVEIILRTYDRYDEASFKKAYSELDQQKYQGVLLAPLMPEASRQLVEAYPNIPFVIFDCPLPDKTPWLSVLQDPFVAGKTAGQLMSHMIDQKSKTAVISYESPNPHQELRVKGFCEVLKKLSYQEPTHYVIPHDLSQAELSTYLKDHAIQLEEYRALFITKTSVHKYAENLAKLKDRPLMIGYDLVQENIDALKRSEIDFLISQGSSVQTYRGLMDLVHYLLDGKDDMKTSMSMPVDILNKENIDLYLQHH